MWPGEKARLVTELGQRNKTRAKSEIKSKREIAKHRVCETKIAFAYNDVLMG
jgi:hypothetical protein